MPATQTDHSFAPVLADRGMVTDALALIEDHGADALAAAALRARSARNQGNLLNFCRWRQIERLIVQLEPEAHAGTIH